MRIITILPVLLSCIGAAVPARAQETPKPASTFSHADFQHVEAADFFMNPGRYLGKPVEFRRMICQPAGEQGFACSTPNGRLSVLAPDLTPASEKKIVEERCRPSDELYQQRCKRTIRLVPQKIEGKRGAEYSQQRLIVRTGAIEVTPLALDSSDE